MSVQIKKPEPYVCCQGALYPPLIFWHCQPLFMSSRHLTSQWHQQQQQQQRVHEGITVDRLMSLSPSPLLSVVVSGTSFSSDSWHTTTPPPPSSLWGGRRGRFFVPIREPGLMCQWQQSGQDWGLSIDFFSPTGAVGLSPIMMCNCNWLVVMSCSVHRALFWVVLFRHQIEETDWNGKGSPELVK